jgi:hybrid cluster-associated redox disulfide protein
MITKDLTIGEILRIKEDAAQILMSFGMGCVGCPSSQAESIEDASKVHGLNLEELLDALNK